MRLASATLPPALLILLGCALTQQTREVAPSGFLEDYSSLSPGKGEQPLLLYIDPDADFGRDHGVVIDPVTIWLEGDSALAEISREEAQRLADYLYTALRREIEQSFTISDRPGPENLRLRAAITEARGSRVPLDIVSTVLPPARLLSAAKMLATGTHAFVGRAGIEIEVLDSASGSRLIAAVDERAGTKALRGSTSSWSDVDAAFDHWASVIAARLALFRDLDRSESSTATP